MTLKDLKIGDHFYPASKSYRATPIYEVVGDPEIIHRNGPEMRSCKNRATDELINKSCKTEVIKTNKEYFHN